MMTDDYATPGFAAGLALFLLCAATGLLTLVLIIREAWERIWL